MLEILNDARLTRILPPELWCIVLDYRRGDYDQKRRDLEKIYRGRIMGVAYVGPKGETIYSTALGALDIKIRWIYNDEHELLVYQYFVKKLNVYHGRVRSCYDLHSVY